MRKVYMWLLSMAAFLFCPSVMQAQVTELAQLALNIEKLAQFKKILTNLKKGYEILSGGYNKVKSISKGNFELHKIFLDGLSEVSPAVKDYYKVYQIADLQVRMIKYSKKTMALARGSTNLSPSEILYLSGIYERILSETLRNAEDLLTVLTASKLRMNDFERLAAIDQLHTRVSDKYQFFRNFNSEVSILALQRARVIGEVGRMREVFDIDK